MNWEDWSYWVRGGIIVVLLYGLSTLALVPFSENCEGAFICIPLWGLPALPVGLIVNILSLGDELGRILGRTDPWGFIVLVSSVYFIVGSIFGWLYGKIRNRKHSTLEPKP